MYIYICVYCIAYHTMYIYIYIYIYIYTYIMTSPARWFHKPRSRSSNSPATSAAGSSGAMFTSRSRESKRRSSWSCTWNFQGIWGCYLGGSENCAIFVIRYSKCYLYIQYIHWSLLLWLNIIVFIIIVVVVYADGSFTVPQKWGWGWGGVEWY